MAAVTVGPSGHPRHHSGLPFGRRPLLQTGRGRELEALASLVVVGPVGAPRTTAATAAEAAQLRQLAEGQVEEGLPEGGAVRRVQERVDRRVTPA